MPETGRINALEGDLGKIEGRVEKIERIVLTGNGDSLVSRVRDLEKDMVEMVEMKATLDGLKSASEREEGRSSAVKDALEQHDKTYSNRLNLMMVLGTIGLLVIAWLTWRDSQRPIQQENIPAISAPAAK